MYNRFIVLNIEYKERSFGSYYVATIKLVDDESRTRRNVSLFIDEENPTEEDLKNAVKSYIDGSRAELIKEESIRNTFDRLIGKDINL